MLVPLIPLFLAANISDFDWQYGPEMTYEAHISLTFPSLDFPILSTQLTCREKSQLVLSCRIKPLKSMKDSAEESNDPPELPEDPFELHFGSGGLEKIVCSSSIDPDVLDTIRSVAEQLSLGADLSTIPHDMFTTMEKSTTGNCIVDYKLTSSKENRNDDDDDRRGSSESSEEEANDLQIVIIPGMQRPDGEVKNIRRTRNLKYCKPQYLHMFAVTEDALVAFDGMDANVKSHIETQFVRNTMHFESSASHMAIRDDSFVSYTRKGFTGKFPPEPEAVPFSEMVELRLINIAAAKGPLMPIPHPLVVSIFPERWIRSGDAK